MRIGTGGPRPFTNLLIIRPRFLGDIILATSLAQAAKDARPGARVTFLVDAAFSELLRHHPSVDDLLSFDTRRRNHPLYLWRFLMDLRSRRFDAVLDLFGNPRTAQWTYFSGAGARVGYRLRGRSWAYNLIAPPSSPTLPSGRRRVTEAYLDQWRALGYPTPVEIRTSLFVTEEERSHAQTLFKRAGVAAGGEVAALSSGASHSAKHWPLPKFVELARRLAASGVRPLFLLGPKDQGLAKDLEAALEPGWLFVNQPSIRGLMALVESSSILVSNDAGPMHVGPAVGTPTVGIFGPGEPEVWFPYGTPHRAAYHEVACSHCGHDVCPLPRLHCMEDLSVDEVEAHARACLAEALP